MQTKVVKKTPIKKMKSYEVWMPVAEYWVFECKAHSKKEISTAVKNGDHESLTGWGQIYGMAANVGASKVLVIKTPTTEEG